MAVYGASSPNAAVYSFSLPKLYEPAMVGIGRKGVDPFTCGNSIVRTVPPLSVTFD